MKIVSVLHIFVSYSIIILSLKTVRAAWKHSFFPSDITLV